MTNNKTSRRIPRGSIVLLQQVLTHHTGERMIWLHQQYWIIVYGCINLSVSTIVVSCCSVRVLW